MPETWQGRKIEHYGEPGEYSLSLDVNGGEALEVSSYNGVDGTSVNIPTPSRTGYSFQGWYTEAEGGDRVVDSGMFYPAGSMTLYAHWSRNGVDVTQEKSGSVAATGYTWYFVINDEGMASITHVSPSPTGTLSIPMTVRDDASGSTAVVTGISPHAFYQAEEMTAVNFPVTLTRIDGCAFSNTGLKDATIPATVTTIDLSAFSDCPELESLTVEAEEMPAENIELYLYSCPKLMTLELPSKLTFEDPDDIYKDMWLGYLPSLQSLSVPEGVTDLGYDGTDDGATLESLASISFPSSLRCVTSRLLYGCWSLDKVVFAGDILRDECDGNGLEWLQGAMAFAGSIYYPQAYADHWSRILRNLGYGGVYGVYSPAQAKLLQSMVASAPLYATTSLPDFGPFAVGIEACQVASSLAGETMTGTVPGIVWDSSTGTLSGTPTRTGTFTVSIGGVERAVRVDPTQDESWVEEGCYGVKWADGEDGRASWLRDRVYQLPPCTETPPESKRFAGWMGSNDRRYDDRVLVFNMTDAGQVVELTPIWE